MLGINGGEIAEFEYRLALAMGATVGVIQASGRAAEKVLPDAEWWPEGRLVQLPEDAKAVWAFVTPLPEVIPPGKLDDAAQVVHKKFLKQNRWKTKEPAMLPWEDLRDDLKNSNRQQVLFAEQILRKVGCSVEGTKPFNGFTDEEIEIMAEMEHGRWIVERLRTGWTYAQERDAEKRRSPYLIPWKNVTEAKEWDRQAMRELPEVLKEAGLEVRRL